jgi:hypothetical protein
MDKDLEYAVCEARNMVMTFEQAVRFIKKMAGVSEIVARKAYREALGKGTDKYEYDVL